MKNASLLFTGLLCLLLLAGCTTPAPGNATLTATPTPSTTPVTGTFPLEVTGTGTMEKNITLPAGQLFVARMDCPGDDFVPFYADITSRDLYQILTNSHGPYNSSQAFGSVNAGIYTFRVIGFGDWTVTIERPLKDPSVSLPLTMHGMGDTTSPLIPLQQGNHSMKYSVVAPEGFELSFYNESGALVFEPSGERLSGLFLDNPCAQGEGTKEVYIPENGYYLFNIRTNGFWDITLG
ncbi:hypothetical protein J2741_002375 [Methanolinea mesophila]|uniref:hypothetical protein n=1 Tax=Methanolinea mesophila TaxID=547055 RepID=UPI001AEA8BD0|nr:hypothetical protein [Methanolinea mesophila]MBP1929779.1 hypothetical protein [Methanolinea mesophila]